MAAAIALNTFNIIAGAAGVVGLGVLVDSFVPKPPPAVTLVTIAVGQTANTLAEDPDNLSGNIPRIRVFAIDGREIGSQKGDSHKTWPAGSFNSVPVKNAKGVENVQAEYVAVYGGGTNGICISALGLKNPNSDTSFGWFADVGQTCGMQFHWSETPVGSTPDTTSYRPNCVWITGFDGSDNGITSQGFSMHIIDFSQITQQRANDYRDNLDLMCNSPPRFSTYTTIYDEVKPPFFIPALRYNATDGSDIDIQKVVNNPGVDKTDYDQNVRVDKDNKPIRARNGRFKPTSTSIRDMFLESIIYSSHDNHSAKELCDAPNSHGPDVVSWKEGLYCDMGEKKLYPLCTKDVFKNCFDTEVHDIRLGLSKRGQNSGKGYTKIQNWGQK
ncbi:hypothetical protein B0J14DRAFT_494504 [Halenospora varia]|nr:hypothetical protein B0J14DRAFT_494504 [Halenospora varia]